MSPFGIDMILLLTVVLHILHFSMVDWKMAVENNFVALIEEELEQKIHEAKKVIVEKS